MIEDGPDARSFSGIGALESPSSSPEIFLARSGGRLSVFVLRSIERLPCGSIVSLSSCAILLPTGGAMDVERTIEFLLAQQARFDKQQARLAEQQAEQRARFDQQHAQVVSDMAELRAVVLELADPQTR